MPTSLGTQPEMPTGPRKLNSWWQPVLVLLLVSLALQGSGSSDARQTLKGSASVTRPSDTVGNPYYPANKQILKADRMTGDYKLGAAEALYRQVLSQNPRHPGGWNGLGKIAWYRSTSSNQNLRNKSQDIYEEAIRHFRTALRYEPGYVEARVNLASIYMEQGRFEDADEELERALDLDPQNHYALARKGEWLVRKERHNEAISYLKQSIRLRSNRNPAAHMYLGTAYATGGQMDDALEELQIAKYQDPDNASVHYQMGQVYEKQGNAAAAIEAYQQALSLKPELSAARRKLAGYLEQRGDFSNALSHYRTLLETEGESGAENWPLTDHIARLALRSGQPRMAVKAYRGWLNAHPDDRQAQAALSHAKIQVAKEKRRDDDLISQGETKRYAEQAIRYNPDNMEAWLINAKLDREMGVVNPVQTGRNPGMVDVALSQPVYHPYQSLEKGMLALSRYQFGQATEAFQAARRTADTPREQMIVGELLLAKALPDLAEQSFRQVLRDMPDNASAKLGLAKARQDRQRSRDLLLEARLDGRKNAVELAIRQAEESLKYNIASADSHYLLATLHESRNHYAQAADHYYAYLQLTPNAENRERIERKIENLKLKLAKSLAK
jgi:tetratricopeptide (TPR) repeat protein